MSTLRNGKIARLPPEIRAQLNQRLANHESSTPILKWLNALPEVQVMLTEAFGGKAIRKQNLTDWRKGGHAAWREQQEAVEMMRRIFADGQELIGAAQGAPADKMAAWVTARYLASAQDAAGRTGADNWNRLRELCHDVVALQRAELRSQRLEFEREKMQAKGISDCRLPIGDLREAQLEQIALEMTRRAEINPAEQEQK